MQRILVVEDDFDIQELLQNFLQEAGYEVATANDGIEALSLFSGQRYDLIILDILLPKIDGYGVCELIRKQSDVPIIMLTALSCEEDQLRGLDLQVDDYIIIIRELRYYWTVNRLLFTLMKKMEYVLLFQGMATIKFQKLKKYLKQMHNHSC